MDLLAASLRYWVVQKMNTDAGWKNVSQSLFLLLFQLRLGWS
jgi:5'-3' exonuclease